MKKAILILFVFLFLLVSFSMNSTVARTIANDPPDVDNLENIFANDPPDVDNLENVQPGVGSESVVPAPSIV